jgi:hypothetical protein
MTQTLATVAARIAGKKYGGRWVAKERRQKARAEVTADRPKVSGEDSPERQS